MILSQYIQGGGAPAGDVVFDDINPTTFEYSGSNTSSNSFLHTFDKSIDPDKKLLVISLMTRLPTNDVTFDGFSLTLIRSEGFGQAGCSMWYGKAADMSDGEHTVVVTHSGSQNACVVRCENLDNVDQSDPFGNTDGESGNLSSSSLSLIIDGGDMLIGIVSKTGFNPNGDGDVNQIVRMTSGDSNNIEGRLSNNSSQTAGSKTDSWTWSSTADTGRIVVGFNNG